MSPAADGPRSMEAGAIAGTVGLAVFLVLHDAWIRPIWFVAPVGLVLAAGGGAVMGAAYRELRPRLPAHPRTAFSVMGIASAVLAPAFIAAEVRGPIYAMGPDGEGVLLVPPADAVVAYVGLLTTAALTGALLGAVIGRTRRAAAAMGAAGFALAAGPGHNVPLLGGTPAVATELAILVAVVVVSSVVLVETERSLARIAARGASAPP